MEDAIELHNWSAYQFGRFEYRLVGYVVLPESRVSFIVSEPIVGVNPVEGTVETVNKIWFKPLNRIDPTQRIDMMYSLGRWIDLNMKSQPRDSSEMVEEELKKK